MAEDFQPFNSVVFRNAYKLAKILQFPEKVLSNLSSLIHFSCFTFTKSKNIDDLCTT